MSPTSRPASPSRSLKNFTITPSYFAFLSPNSAFQTFQGLNMNLAYDDTDLLHAFALHPHFTTLFELENKAGNGNDEGVYYEVGIAPSAPARPGRPSPCRSRPASVRITSTRKSGLRLRLRRRECRPTR